MKKSTDLITERIKRNNKGYFSYDRIYKYLKTRGNPMDLSPAGFLILKVLFSIIFFIILLGKDILASILAAIFGFFLLDLLHDLSDKNDMKKIRLQIADVYDFLNIQTAAGVFIGTALTEAYLIVRNKRLKKALAELCAEINLTKNIEVSLDNFNENFISVEIDAFVLTIKQSLKTGKSQQALEDLANSQKDANLVLLQEETDRVKSTKTIIQILMYMGILAVVFYGLFTELKDSFGGIGF